MRKALSTFPESCANLGEAKRVLAALMCLLGCNLPTAKQVSIFIITPYNAQEALVRSLLAENRHVNGMNAKIEVGSIHSIQGGEADFVIISTVRSPSGMERLAEELCNSPRLPKWLRANLGHVASDNMLNVAISRGKHGVLVVGNKHLLSLHQGWDMLIRACKSGSSGS